MIAYDYLVEIDWSGIPYIAARKLTHDGKGFTPILLGLPSAVVNSVEPGRRSSTAVRISNEVLEDGTRFSDGFDSERIEGKGVTITELHRETGETRTLFVGVVLSRRYDELTVELELVEPSLSRSKRLDAIVDSATWTRARPEDVGASIPVPIGTVPDAICPVVTWNPHSRLTEEIDESATSLTLDSVEGFPSAATVRIDREKLTYSGVNTSTKQLTGLTRGVLGTAAAPHAGGSLVVRVASFEIGIDASGKATSVNKAEAVTADGERFALADPDSEPVVNGARVARWDETPTYLAPKGELEAITIELDSDDGSNCPAPFFARGRDPAYTESNYAFPNTFAATETFKSKVTRQQATRGRIRKVLLTANHSGTNSELVPDPATLGTVEVKAGLDSGSTSLVGYLSESDEIDPDFMELAEKRGRRPVDVFDTGATGEQTKSFSPDSVAVNGSGGASIGYLVAYPKENAIDGSQSVAAIATDAGSGEGRIEFSISAVPAGVDPTATLKQVRFKFLHGGPGPVGAEVTGATGDISLRRSGSTVAGPGTFNSNNTAKALETATYTPGGSPAVSDITNYVGRVDLGNILTVARWNVWEAWFEIDYEDAGGAEKSSGSIVNQFDVTTLIDSWEDLSEGVIEIVQTTSSAGFRLYHAAFVVIYEPQLEKVPERIALELDAAISGRAADVIEELWLDADLGNNGLGTISGATAASVAQNAAGFTAATLAGLIREESLWETVRRLARETRLRAYVVAGVLELAFIPDLSALGSPTRRIDRTDLAAAAAVDGVDVEVDLVNRVRAVFDLTDVEGFRGSLTDEVAASVTAYGEQLEELEFRFVRTAAAAQLTVDSLLERRGSPWDRVEFPVTLHLRSIALLELLELAFVWFRTTTFEVEELVENLDHTITVKGRTL